MVANPAFAASAIPSTHTAAVSEKVGDYPVLKQLTTPRPSSLLAGQALVKICFAGVCHSDVALALGKGTHRPLEPIISGHEGTGYIVALGPHTRPGPGPKIGDKVGIKFIADTCGNCNACETGHEECCLTPSISGITRDGVCKAFRFESLGDADNCGDPSPASALYVFYTLLTASSQFVVASTLHLTPLPEGISLMSAAPILCAGVTVYKALMAAGLDPGDYVVIPGAGGGLGHLAVQYALAMNYRVIAIDSGEDKRALMLRYGVYLWIDFRDEPDLVAAIRHAAGGHPIKAAIVTAGSIAPYQQVPLQISHSAATHLKKGVAISGT
ncbi:hypothetical protein P7C73_g1700, partial [Tremellales sp. Uapishka_1]